MSSEHAIDKDGISIRIPRSLKIKVQKMAASHNMTMKQYVEFLLYRACNDVALTSKDYEQITQQVRKAEDRRLARRNNRLH